MVVLSALTTVAAAGVVGYTYVLQHGSPSPAKSDAKKIQRIFVNRGLSVKEGKNIRTIQQLRRRDIVGGREYVFRIPLGLSYEDFKKQLPALEDGLNNRRQRREITITDIKAVRTLKDIIELWQREPERVQKEIEMNYDGVLKIKVYDKPLPDQFTYTDETANSCNRWEIPVGYNRSGLVKHDFADIPHLLVAGATGKGKSVFLKNAITTLINNQPDNLQLTLIDLKGGLAFARYAQCKQTTTLAKSVEEAHSALIKIRETLEQRMSFLLANGYEDVSEMGDKKRHFIVIDEAAELSSAGETDPNLKKMKVACEALVSDIARRGRAVGLRLVYATQYPTNETLKSQVRQNIGARVCFFLSTAIASRVVLDEAGAEELPQINGRAIYSHDSKVIVQTPYISNDYIKKVIEPHIVIRAKEERHAKSIDTRDERGTDTLIIEEVGLSES